MAFWKKSKPDHPYTVAIVAAGGSGSRFGGNKLVAELAGLPVLAHTLTALEKCSCIDEVILAAKSEEMLAYAQIARNCGAEKVSKVIAGGATRLESVYRGILEIDRKGRFAAVQDAARPLTAPELIEAVCRKAYDTGCAYAAVPVRDTIRLRGENEREPAKTLPRERLLAAQTPQVFDLDLLRAALKRALDAGTAVTDDCGAVELLGARPVPVEGSAYNLKITEPQDLLLAEALLTMEET